MHLTGLQPVCRLRTTADQSFRSLQIGEGSLLLLLLNGDSVIGALCLVSFFRYWVMWRCLVLSDPISIHTDMTNCKYYTVTKLTLFRRSEIMKYNKEMIWNQQFYSFIKCLVPLLCVSHLFILINWSLASVRISVKVEVLADLQNSGMLTQRDGGKTIIIILKNLLLLLLLINMESVAKPFPKNLNLITLQWENIQHSCQSSQEWTP